MTVTTRLESDSSCWDVASSCLTDMNEEQTARLTRLLDEYLCGLEQGEPLDVDELLRENEDISETLRAYLDKLHDLHGIAAGIQQSVFGSAELGENARLGEYTILREVGRGGMGIVFEARQDSLDRRVAIKLLPMTAMLDTRQIARFKNESHAAGQLQHPNIVSVHGVGSERGIHYYAMQFIDGGGVDAWIQQKRDRADARSDDWRTAVELAVEAAEALDYAHGCGIVHRDIKPSNLLLDHDQRIWVTDFGLARCQNALSLTRSGDLIGTMRYMSPEQACGRAELVDHRTDIYSLAATLYEMLTLEPAVQGDDGPGLLRAIGKDAPVRVRKTIPNVPRDLDVVLRKAMSKEKDDRYATAKEFADDLRAVLDGRATVAKPPSIPTLTGRFIVRHHRLVTAAMVIVVLATCWLAISSIAILQSGRAVQDQIARADRHFRQARDTVDVLGMDVADELALIPGTEPVRGRILQATLEYYQRFVVDAANDPKLISDLALTHSRIGSIVRELDSPASAIVHFDRAEEAFRRFDQSTSVDESGAAVNQSMRAQNLNRLGLACFDAGLLGRAESAYRTAHRLQKQLIAAHPDNDTYAVDYALTLSNIGLLEARIGDRSDASRSLQESIERLEILVERNPDHVTARRGLAAALVNRSSLPTTAPEEAAELLDQALRCQVETSRLIPHPLRSSAEIAATYNNLGSAWLQADQASNAVDAFNQSISLLRQLTKLSPQVRSHWLDLSTSLNNLAKAHHTRGRYVEAERASREAVRIHSSKMDDRSDAGSHSRLGAMYSNLSQALEALGNDREAIEAIHHAIDHQRIAIESREDPEFRNYLTRHYSHLLRLQMGAREWTQSAKTANEYVMSAASNPQALMTVAEDLARSASETPAGGQRDRRLALVASALVSAKKAGFQFDESILGRRAFEPFADSTILRKAMRP